MARGNLPAQTPAVPQDTFFSFDLLYRFSQELSKDLATLEGKSLAVAAARDSSTRVDQIEFSLAIRAFRIVKFKFYLMFSGNVSFQITGPASPTLVLLRSDLANTASHSVAVSHASSYPAAISSVSPGICVLEGLIQNGANPGFINLEWGQNTTSAPDSLLYAGSNAAYSLIV